MTQDWSRALLTISVSYKEDTDRVISELKNILNDFTNDKKYKNLFLEKPEILGDDGIDELGNYAIKFKIACKVKPSNQWLVERQLREKDKGQV